jgi:hypothetical protein
MYPRGGIFISEHLFYPIVKYLGFGDDASRDFKMMVGCLG